MGTAEDTKRQEGLRVHSQLLKYTTEDKTSPYTEHVLPFVDQYIQDTFYRDILISLLVD